MVPSKSHDFGWFCILSTLSHTTDLRLPKDSSKLKESANDNFKFDENDRKFSKWACLGKS